MLALTPERRDPHEPPHLRTTQNCFFGAGLRSTAPAHKIGARDFEKERKVKRLLQTICVFLFKVELSGPARRRERRNMHEVPRGRTTLAVAGKLGGRFIYI